MYGSINSTCKVLQVSVVKFVKLMGADFLKEKAKNCHLNFCIGELIFKKNTTAPLHISLSL